MASLVIVAAIVVAVKSPDWIEQYKQRKAKKAALSDTDYSLPPDYFGPSSDGTETTSGTRSKREMLTRKYWHERRESARSREQMQSLERRTSADTLESPPYNGPPMYQENEMTELPLPQRTENAVYFHCP
ncbi:hypothetical protein BJY01DRAFT_248318 [Aspergillus pseudoustus]|uniref:Uncharacterized protein n=1 Tax=Aspergillus pseudoustus TaxID=1810923 RepID=A0ABR4JVJ2_9EURO